MSDKRNGEKTACIKAGLTIAGKYFFGDKNNQLRKDAQVAGAVFDSKLSTWVFPDQPTLIEFQKRLGLGVTVVETPVVTVPPPRAATSLPAPKVEAREFPVDGLPGGVVFPSTPVEVKPPSQVIPASIKNPGCLLPLKPAILVYYNVRIDADVSHRHLDEKTETKANEEEGTKDVKRTATVETNVKNEEEYQKTKALRSQFYGMLRKLGDAFAASVLLVPLESEAELDKTSTEIEELAFKHNAEAHNHFIRPIIIPGAVMGSKAESVAKQAAFDLQELLGRMQKALDECDSEKISQIATSLRIKSLALEPGMAQGALAAAINDARKMGSKIRQEVEKKGRAIEEVKRELKSQRMTSTVDSARMMFLDFDIPTELAQARVSANAARFEALETQVSATELPPPAKVVNGNRFDF